VAEKMFKMENKNYSATIEVEQSPQEAFRGGISILKPAFVNSSPNYKTSEGLRLINKIRNRIVY